MFDNSYLIGIIAVVLILIIGGGIAGFVIFMIKKNSKGSATVIGMSGIMNGKTYGVKDLLTFGRNKEMCDVCYPVNTQGISGVHCQIQRQGNKYVLIDRGSSYGSFTGNGTKVQPNVPAVLENGDFFFLGEREQLFQIRY